MLNSCVLRHSLLCAGLALAPISVSAASATPAGTFTFTVVNDGFDSWLLNGQPDPTIQLIRGETYVFDLQGVPSNHPFFINTISTTGSGNQFTLGVTGNGATVNGDVTFVVPASAPDQLFYNCGNHPSMAGTINIVNETPVFGDGFE
jgi:hypothetical protein